MKKCATFLHILIDLVLADLTKGKVLQSDLNGETLIPMLSFYWKTLFEIMKNSANGLCTI
jgi:hypothetical protein